MATPIKYVRLLSGHEMPLVGSELKNFHFIIIDCSYTLSNKKVFNIFSWNLQDKGS